MTPGGKLANAVGRLHQYHVAAIDARTGIDAPEADGRAGRGIPDEAWSGIDREVEHGGRDKQGEADDTGNQDHAAETRARSEEHTSELQSLMRISYAVFRLKQKKN